jgi:hypothetical protein
MTVCCPGWIVVHQVGFSLHDYIEMHGQQNIKNLIQQVIVTINGMDDPGLESRKRQDISLLQEVKIGYGTYTVSYSTVNKVFLLG